MTGAVAEISRLVTSAVLSTALKRSVLVIASGDSITERSLVAEGAKLVVAMDKSEMIEEKIPGVAESNGSAEYGGIEPISVVCCDKSLLESNAPLITLVTVGSVGVGTRVVSGSATSVVAIDDGSVSSLKVACTIVLGLTISEIDVTWVKLSVICARSIPALVTGISSTEAVMLGPPSAEVMNGTASEISGSKDTIEEVISP